MVGVIGKHRKWEGEAREYGRVLCSKEIDIPLQ